MISVMTPCELQRTFFRVQSRKAQFGSILICALATVFFSFVMAAPVQATIFNPPIAAGTLTPVNCTPTNISIGVMAQPNDKVVAIYEGYFTQAGNYSAIFTPSGGGLGSADEHHTLSMDAKVVQLPVDLAITKQVSTNSGGPFGSTATIPLLTIVDKFTTPGTPQDIVVNITLNSFQCNPSSTLVNCPNLPTISISGQLGPASAMTTTIRSNGLLPAGESYEITFTAHLSTPSLCSPSQNNQLDNSAYFTYSNGNRCDVPTGRLAPMHCHRDHATTASE